MSRNIKEIGKELMGKSLNSFHRKTGLTQLEENNKMQDGILDGILSQVDDAYIEKTEQSNVIHLDGSGDGVVVLDSIEGNTMVNILGDGFNTPSNYVRNDWGSNNSLTFDGDWVTVNSTHEWSGLTRSSNTMPLKPNTTYTLIVEVRENTLSIPYQILHANGNIFKQGNTDLGVGFVGIKKFLFTTQSDLTDKKLFQVVSGQLSANSTDKIVYRQVLLEGDWTNKEVPYFNSLQSSFEEEVEEDKYKIEILSDNGGNLLHGTTYTNGYFVGRDNGNLIVNNEFSYSDYIEINSIHKKMYAKSCNFNICFYDNNKSFLHGSKYGVGTDENYWVEIPKNAKYFRISVAIVAQKLANVSYQDVCNNVKPKQNKIKLLINEPLRSTPHNISDRLCIKDKRLVVERKCGEITLDGSEDWILDQYFETFGQVRIGHIGFDRKNKPRNKLYSTTYTQCKIYSDNMKNASKLTNNSTENLDTVFAGDSEHYALFVKFKNSTLGLSDGVDVGNFISKVTEYLRNKNVTVVYELATPYYEEVLNEYGEPIILEGYENGTIYIDSTIVPTTTVRYTPKMESFKTLKEVENNNIMLTNDVNNNIIPYMMDVDLMIMEKEMALMSQYKIRRIGAKDMTSMQKRTQDMLTRLIKGKTLTEQECKTRVVTYLDAGKITDAQADELMLLISEVYA